MMSILLLSALAFAQSTEDSLRAENAALRDAVGALQEEVVLLEAAAQQTTRALVLKDNALAYKDQEIGALNRVITIQGQTIDIYAVQLDSSEKLANDWERMYRAEVSRKGPGKAERVIWATVSAALVAAIVVQSVSDDGVTIVTTQ